MLYNLYGVPGSYYCRRMVCMPRYVVHCFSGSRRLNKIDEFWQQISHTGLSERDEIWQIDRGAFYVSRLRMITDGSPWGDKIVKHVKMVMLCSYTV